jgi:hypothetical protein
LHYTTAAGFKGIVKSGQVWCTDICCVDDPTEGNHGLEVIKSVLQRKSVPSKFREAIQRSRDLFGLKRIYTSYVCCFASGLDQSRMWTYAENGTGCAINFDYKVLEAGAEGGSKYAVVRMLYECPAQVRKVEQIVDHAIQLQRRRSFSLDDAAQFWNEEVAFSLLNCGMLFKAPKWDYQREFRLVVMGGDNASPFLVEGRPRVALQFDRSAIIGVVRAPNAGAALQTERIHAMMQDAGYGESVPILNAISE